MLCKLPRREHPHPELRIVRENEVHYFCFVKFHRGA